MYFKDDYLLKSDVSIMAHLTLAIKTQGEKNRLTSDQPAYPELLDSCTNSLRFGL